MKRTWIYRAMVGGAAVGASAAGFAIVSAVQSTPQQKTVGEVSATTVLKSEPTLILSATTGKEAPVFSGDVSILQEGRATVDGADSTTIALHDEGTQTCIDTKSPVYVSSTCYDPATLESGLAYSAVLASGRIYLVGVVPDDAAIVEINGLPIVVKNNIWQSSVVAEAGQLSLQVSSADGKRIAHLG